MVPAVNVAMRISILEKFMQMTQNIYSYTRKNTYKFPNLLSIGTLISYNIIVVNKEKF